MDTDRTHVFESRGLGKAPYRYVGHESFGEGGGAGPGQRVIGEINGCTISTKPGTCCDYCLTYIIDAYWLMSADGRRFKVGCDCVRKTKDTWLVSEVDRAARKLATDRRHAREKATIGKGREMLADETVRAALAAKPHPQKWQAEKGATLLDWAEWMMANAGAKGRVSVAKAIRAEAAS